MFDCSQRTSQRLAVSIVAQWNTRDNGNMQTLHSLTFGLIWLVLDISGHVSVSVCCSASTGGVQY